VVVWPVEIGKVAGNNSTITHRDLSVGCRKSWLTYTEASAAGESLDPSMKPEEY
jgi:hypothetical protein